MRDRPIETDENLGEDPPRGSRDEVVVVGVGELAGREDERDEISLVQVANVLLRSRYLIIATTLGLAFLVALVTRLSAPDFTASASFVPQSERAPSGRLATLAGQFGIDVPTGEVGQSPRFYADLIESREILDPIAEERFSFHVPGADGDSTLVSGSVAELMEIAEDESPPVRHAAAVGWLRNQAVEPATDEETGVVRVSVTTPYAELSSLITERLLDLVNRFNLETRRSQAAEERRFVEERLTDARASLRAAEDELRNFLQSNRRYENSPDLVFEYDRLQREVTIQQQVYTSLAQAYDEARIAEVRNTPVITVIEGPATPVRPDPKHLIIKVALGLFLGAMLGLFLAVAREYVQRSREDDRDEMREFDSLWRETKRDFRKLGRRVRKEEAPSGP